MKNNQKVILLLTILFKTLAFFAYDNSYYNLAKNLKKDTGVVVIAYNRPHYFKQALDALAANPESQILPFIFILDGGPNATQQENIKIINDSNIKSKFIIAHETNYGCGRTLIDARRFMFEWCRFKKILFFEDDIVISPDYISLTLNLYDYAKKYYKNVGLVQCFNRCFLPAQIKLKNLYTVTEVFGNYWGYCMDKKTYNSIKDMLNYHEKNNLLPYSQNNPNGLIVADWIEKHMLAAKPVESKNSYFINTRVDWFNFFSNLIEKLRLDLSYHRVGQDFEMRLALWKANLVKINTLVSRAKYIGAEGTSHHSANHQLLGYDLEDIIFYENDKNIKNFIFSPTINFDKKIMFDLSLYKNSTRRKYLSPSVVKLIDNFVENGYPVIIKKSKNIEMITKNLYYKVPICFSRDELSGSYDFEVILPIFSKKDCELLIESNNFTNNTFLYITTSIAIEMCINHKNVITQKTNGIIVGNSSIYDALVRIFDESFVLMWHDIFKIL